ncbi:MAG: hypothetical protein ABIH26_06995 [Candidatus Eisenbacteria bacterium]
MMVALAHGTSVPRLGVRGGKSGLSGMASPLVLYPLRTRLDMIAQIAFQEIPSVIRRKVKTLIAEECVILVDFTSGQQNVVAEHTDEEPGCADIITYELSTLCRTQKHPKSINH